MSRVTKARKALSNDPYGGNSNHQKKATTLPRLGLEKFFQKSKMKRSFGSNYEMNSMLGDSNSFDEGYTTPDKEVYDDTTVEIKPRLRRRHSFSTVEMITQLYRDTVSSIVNVFLCRRPIRG